MQIIYAPQGRAAEYAYLCTNLYGGSCQHKCLYCYCPDVQRTTRERWLLDPPHPRKDVIKLLKNEAPKYAGTNKRLHLTFLNDCYQPIEKEFGITRKALEIFRENNIPFQILTKGGKLAERDFDLYGEYDMFGVTLTCATDEGSRKYEPGAAPTSERIKSLERARERGIYTWVSLEPVLSDVTTLMLIEMTHEFVCHYKVGVLNHQPPPKPIDWRGFGIVAIQFCRKFGVSYFIKEDLAKHLDGITWTQTDTRIVIR